MEPHEVWRHVKITHPTRRTVIAAASTLSLGIVTLAGVGVAQTHHNVTVEVDGVSQPVSGFMLTVSDALKQAGVTPGEHDEIVPHVSESPTDNMTIVVRTAHPFAVAVDGQQRTIWSTAQTYSDVLETLGEGTIIAADRSGERGALPLLDGTQKINIHVDGTTYTIDATPTDSADTLLAKAGITVSPNDRVRLIHTKQGLTLNVARVLRATTTTVETLEPSVEERLDDTLYEGESTVLEEGTPGSLITTTYTETIDGVTTVHHISAHARTEPTTRILLKGTKPRPAASSATYANTSAPSPIGNADAWAALAQCESGGNPATNTGNGYYGMYQFSLPTWQSVGGTGLPSDASAEEQTMRAQILQQRSGWGQWPACSARLGLY